MSEKTTLNLRKRDKDRFDEIAERMFDGYDVPQRVVLNRLMDSYEESEA